jgi:oligopeptide transport system substrate-binding protein
LLAYLLLTGKPHSRQHLVDLLFFEGPDDPRAALRWTLSKLRKAIGSDFILADRQEVAFNFDADHWLDVDALEREGQLDLYKGDFLEGLHVRDAFAFEDWAFFERERLRNAHQVALEQQLAEHEKGGDDAAAIETAHQLLRLDNLREDWYRALMKAYARSGRRDAALAQFERCQHILQSELGVEPVTETIVLAETIQTGQFEAARPGVRRGHLRIAARFIVEDVERDLIGQGSMGQVYRGVDAQTGVPVAVKVINADIVASQPNAVKRFVQEGQILRRLDHPSIVKMLAAVEQAGQHYLIMEHVEGGSLRELLQAQGPLPVDRAARIVLDLADALAEAHRLDIIHRDLKPTNVLLAEDGTPRLTDFGIARIAGGSPLTTPGVVVGTVNYLSPEACEGKPLDARGDIWALGVLLFEVLAGECPFTGDTLAATVATILSQPVPDLAQLRRDVPSRIVDLIHRMLEKDPERRIADARLVSADLAAIVEGKERVRVPLPSEEAPRDAPAVLVRRPRCARPRFPTSLVGRAGEMEVLHRAWRRVAEGQGHMLLVQGEPGIGKTRLVEQLLVELGDQAFVLRAQCHDLEEPLTYTLFVEPLRQALSAGRPPDLSDTQLTEISRLLPELPEQYPDLPQPISLDPAAERRRLFDAICAALMALAEQQPLILLADDLQWVDPTSLAVLNHLSGWIAETPLLVLGTYRPHEVDAVHPLRRTRRNWERAGLLTELALGPLTEDAVWALLKELTTWTGGEPSFGQLIYQETRGNPLFVVETVASLRDQGRLPQDAEGWRQDFRAETVTIPPRIQTIVEARIDRLDGLSRQVLTAAAVMRSSFRADVVQAVSGRSELETLEGLERLLTSDLLFEEETGRFRFSHEKVREVAYQGLSQLRRQLLHRRMAEALERLYRGRERSIAERLAYHYERAGAQERAVDYHLQAGHAARELYAHETAVRHYQRALAHLRERGDLERAARTLMQLGLTFHGAFDFQQARRAYEEGFVLWQKAGQAAPIAPQVPAPHALRMIVDDPPTVDPAVAGDAASAVIITQLFSGLVESGPEMDVVPDVAQSWEVLKGGRKYVFRLRPDVRWSDGEPVTARDFEYAWKRVVNPATGSPVVSLFYDIKGVKSLYEGDSSDLSSIGVRSVDEHTLLVELEEPTGYFLQLLAYHPFRPVPRHVLEARGGAWMTPEGFVSNGPFKLEAWKPGELLSLVRDPGYHGRVRGNVERVELISRKEQFTCLEMYQADRVDILVDNLDVLALPPAEMDRVRRQHAGEFFSTPVLSTCYVGFNAQQVPFDEPRVRQALALATDKDTLAYVVMKGHIAPADGGFTPPWMPGHAEGIGLPYDPERARQLLAEAGYPGGRGFPAVRGLMFMGSASRMVAEYLEAQWREQLGIEIHWDPLEWVHMLKRLYEDPPQLHLNSWLADYADPDSFLRVCLQQISPSIGWWDEVYANLVEQARRVTVQDERMRLYRQADKILVHEAVVIPLHYGRCHLLVKHWVSQHPTSALGRQFWKDVIIEPH